jgi:hypothetical protein
MTGQDSMQAARGVVEAFNASDWDSSKAALTSDSVYDEVGTSRRLQASGTSFCAGRGGNRPCRTSKAP